MRRQSRRIGALFGLAGLLVPISVQAESVVIVARLPAKFAEPSLLRKIVMGSFSGRGGATLSSALSQRLTMPGPDGQPYFTLIERAARSSGVGILSGDVGIEVSETAFTQQQSRCVEGAGLFSCKRSVMVTVACRQRAAVATVNIRIVRASDGKIVYSTTKPYRDASTWCEGASPPPDIDSQFLAVSAQIANLVAEEISPHTISYKVRLLEDTKGLSKAGAATFKALVKASKSDLATSCTGWKQLSDQGENAPSLKFDLGICAEQGGDLSTAARVYDETARLVPGEKAVVESIARVRTLVAARAAANTQSAQRAQSEATERQQALDAVRAQRAAAAAEQQKARHQAADAAAVKGHARQAVVAKYGAGDADAIMSGTVRKGMSPAAVRAAVGGNCRIQTLGAGLEQWYCGAKRIVFTGGRVTDVR